MAMDYEDLKTYCSYSEYKTICQKHLPAVNGDETKIVQLFDVLNEDPNDDIYLLKVNALLDICCTISTTSTTTSPTSSVQEVLVNPRWPIVKTVISRALSSLERFVSPDCGAGDGETAGEGVTSGVRLLLYIYTRLESPPPPPTSSPVSDLLRLLITNPECPLETALLAGSVTAALAALHSDSDEGCLAVFSRLLAASSQDLLTISYLSGILTSTKSVILLGQDKNSNVLFMFSLLEHIKVLCAKSTRYDYHSFLLLRQWSSRCLEISKQIKSESDDNYRLDIKEKSLLDVIEICRNNFENPLKGVSELCYSSYSDTLELTSLCLDSEASARLEAAMLAEVRNLSWSRKTKYVQLSALLERLGQDRILSSQPNLPASLSQCLSSPNLVHAGTELYVKLIRRLENWSDLFGSVLVESLLEDNAGVRLACLEQWLPATLKHVKDSHLYVLGELRKIKTQPAMLGLLTVFRICKNKGLEISQTEMNLSELMKECLFHSDSSVRSAAFGLVCQAKKKGSVPPAEELQLVLQFLARAGSDSSAKFRQNIRSSWSVLCARCRDRAAMVTRSRQRQSGAATIDTATTEDLQQIIEFLDVALKVLVGNLLPGGNYQRKIFSLDLLLVFINNFYNFQSGVGANKKSGNGDPTEFVKVANESGKMCLFEEEIFQIIALNLDDHMIDVKERTFEILNLFSPSTEILSEMFLVMKSRINSSKEGICETGSLLAKLLSNSKNNSTVIGESDSVCDFLLSSLKSGVARCGENFLDSARNFPLYGIILSLRKCLLDPDSAERFSFNQEKLKSLISTLEEISEMMLTVLCGEFSGGKTSKNPDFQEMSKAISSMLAGCNGGEDTEGDVSIPEEHQLVLSAAWHSLKECVLLTGHLVHQLDLVLLPATDCSNSLSLEDTQRCCGLLRTVVSLCRHKGVIEASTLTSGLMASSLLASNIPAFHSLPRTIMEETFSQLETEWSKSSFTRRGAGLPGLIQKLVSSEPSSKPRQLLPLAVRRLTQIAGTPSAQAETEDSASSHSLHILRGLVQDAQVARELGPFITEITATCLSTFSSSSWSVRNAGLQLFGALAPRIVGQKKIKEDSESYNIVSLAEMVARFPGLVQLLLDKLNASSCQTPGGPSCLLEPCVVPVMNLLARMESRQQENELAGQVSDCVLKFRASPVVTVRWEIF